MRLLFLGPKSSPYVLIRYRAFIIFGKKIHPVQLLNTVCLLNLGFFLKYFGLFHQYFPNFPPFNANFIHFSHLVPFLKFWIYRQKLRSAFISSCAFIKILVFFHPVCLFNTVRLLKLGGSSTLCVYSIPYFYSIV